jgi:hypothetical protein
METHPIVWVSTVGDSLTPVGLPCRKWVLEHTIHSSCGIPKSESTTVHSQINTLSLHPPLPLPRMAPTTRPKLDALPKRNAPSPTSLVGTTTSPSGRPRRAHAAGLRKPHPRAIVVADLGLTLPSRLLPPLLSVASVGGSEGRPRSVVMEAQAIAMEAHPKDRVSVLLV